MKNDRKRICEIISKMLDNPDEIGIYPTTEAYDELEKYIDGVRAEAVGVAWGYACQLLDKGEDARKMELPALLLTAKKILENSQCPKKS